ncbi:MAG TPA: S8 family serine peptidase [Thermoanaerobaculia bacterium]|jgi:subtilisin family serine protease|nr:S8 family serine peptidase [Thermoanaerobaculia bacterium]
MKRAALSVFLFVLPFTAFASTAPTQAVIVMMKQTGRLTVKSLAVNLDPSISDDARDVRDLPGIHGFAANLTDDEIASLKASGNVISIEPDLERHAFSDSVTAGAQTTPYGVTDVDAPPVWPVTRGKSLSNGPAIHVAIIDTGIDYNFSELSAAFKGGHNFVARTEDPLDDNGHGTHVAGIIAAANNAGGVVGVASDVDLYSLKVLDTCGSGRTSDIIAAVDWVVQKKKEIGGNWIVNLSLGSDSASTSEETEFDTAKAAGILVFAASGNSYEGTDGLSYPAGYSSVVSVGAVDSNNVIADFSQRGADLKLVAPGVSVISTFLNGRVAADDGRKVPATFADGTLSNGDSACLSKGPVTAKFVSCGTGNATEIPASVSGKIALIERGGNDPAGTSLTFLAKTRNALAKGAIGVVVYSNANPVVTPGFSGLTKTDVTTLPPMALIERADGLALLATPNATLTMSFDSHGLTELFALLSGTSMATPHAVGTAALVWAVSPNSTNNNVATALEQTAKDLGAPGQDTTYGYGLVDALAAAKQLNPSAFAVNARMPGRRGH